MKGVECLLVPAEVCSKLSRTERRELAGIAVHRRFVPRQFVCHQGDIWPKVIPIVSGQLAWIILSTEGREYVSSTMEAGDVIWCHSIFDDQPMPACIVATDTSETLQWYRDDILPILYRNPSAMWDIARAQARAMRRAREIIYSLAFQPVAARLANLLLRRYANQRAVCLERDLTLSDIAAMVASSPEVVCRLLHQFQVEGMLEITRAQITLRSQEALESLARRA